MDKREDRRDRTIRIGARRRNHHLRVVHPDGVIDCVCERSVWRFAKRPALGCGCSKKSHGHPKWGNGPCNVAPRLRHSVLARRAWAKIHHALIADLRAGVDAADIDPFVEPMPE